MTELPFPSYDFQSVELEIKCKLVLHQLSNTSFITAQICLQRLINNPEPGFPLSLRGVRAVCVKGVNRSTSVVLVLLGGRTPQSHYDCVSSLT